MNYDFPIEVVRSLKSKSAAIEIDKGIVKVTVPQNLSDYRVDELVKKRTIWIKKQLKIEAETPSLRPKEYVNGETFSYLGRNYRLKCVDDETRDVKLKHGYLTVHLSKALKANEKEYFIKQSLKDWYQARALEKLKEKTKRYSSIIGVTPKSVNVKEYKARWGSCSAKGDISFNWRIIISPHHIVDYIVVHELCHLLEYNHGSKYWKQVGSVIPNYDECRNWLKVYGEDLRI